jgi:thioredoxin reductase (NADPH)
MSAPIHAKVVIIGSGPAGYTAAIYAARAMLEPVLIQGIQPGGQLTITTDVENYPGFADVIQGPWLMEQMEKQAAHVGTKIVTDLVTKLELAQRPFRLTCDSGDVYLAETVILATGAQARWLGIPSEEKFKGFGVSACATCDGFFYRGKEVVVVGGGNTAVEEAMFLTNFASKVTIVHRRDHFRAERILQDRLFKNPKIKVVWDAAIDEIRGTDDPNKVTHVRLKNVKTGTLTELPADGVFIAIGHAPATELVRGQVKLKPSGYVEVAPNSTATSVPSPTKPIARRSPPPGSAAWRRWRPNASSHFAPTNARRLNDHEHYSNPRWIYRYGLGQAEGVSRRGGSGQLHARRRTAWTVAIGGVPPGQRARTGIVGVAVPPPRARPDSHRAGRPFVPHRA